MNRLSESIRLYFAVNKLSQRKMAPLMEIDHVTLSRFLGGKDIEIGSYKKILKWIMEL